MSSIHVEVQLNHSQLPRRIGPLYFGGFWAVSCGLLLVRVTGSRRRRQQDTPAQSRGRASTLCCGRRRRGAPAAHPAALIGGIPGCCRRGRSAPASSGRGGLVLPPGVVGRGRGPRRGGAHRLPPPLRARQRRRLRLRVPRIPPGKPRLCFPA